jgi:hypothetical protein
MANLTVSKTVHSGSNPGIPAIAEGSHNGIAAVSKTAGLLTCKSSTLLPSANLQTSEVWVNGKTTGLLNRRPTGYTGSTPVASASFGPVAQSDSEHLITNQEVAGSSPAGFIQIQKVRNRLHW